MYSFLKFIFTLIIIGVIVNLAIVVLSNARSHQTQTREKTLERQRFAHIIKLLNKQLRRGEMVVEWQRVDAYHNVIETSLLVRQYMPHEDGAVPLTTTRIIIPGNRVCIDGLKLYFDHLFNENYAELRDVTLFYFGRVYADGSPKAKAFNFIPPDSVPLATQVHATDERPHPTYFENKLWQELWPLINGPSQTRAEKRGLKVKWIDPVCRTVKGGALYKISVGLEGITIVEEDESFGRSSREDMLNEMKPDPKRKP